MTPILSKVSLATAIKERVGVQSSHVFERLWRQSLAAHRITPTPEIAEKIAAAVQQTLIYHGQGVTLSLPPCEHNPQIDGVIAFLLGQGQAPKSWINRANAKGVFLQSDAALLQAMEAAFRKVLTAACERLQAVGEQSELLFQSFIGHVVALLPYCCPKEGASFTIPQKIDGAWKAVSYTVDRKIELTPRWFSSPIAAFGLTAPDGPPLLTFLGTTFPAGEGFLATLLSDFTPGLSVGHAPYLSGRKKIEAWLEKNAKARLYGTSLGGALALHTLRHQDGAVDSLHVYNPPGLYPWNWKGHEGNGTEVNIFYQDNDLVGSMGHFPTGPKVSVYRVIGQKKESPLNAHARVLTAGAEVTLLKSSAAYENSRLSRKLLTALHLLCSGFVIFLPTLFFYALYLLGSGASRLMPYRKA